MEVLFQDLNEGNIIHFNIIMDHYSTGKINYIQENEGKLVIGFKWITITNSVIKDIACAFELNEKFTIIE